MTDLYGSEQYGKAEVDRLVGVLTDARMSGAAAGTDRALARIVLAAGFRFVDPSDTHVIELTETGWTISHPLTCRAGGVGALFDCEVNRVVAAHLTEPPQIPPGCYRLTVEDGEPVIGDHIEREPSS